MTTLPDLPSALIRVALADLAKVEAMPEAYKVHMGYWHLPWAGKCIACLAGSVMAMTLNAPPDDEFAPADFRATGNNHKLFALEWFRRGNISGGLMQLEIEWTAAMDRKIADYSVDPALFRSDMESLASDLEAAGL
jgi:hypothetical protein